MRTPTLAALVIGAAIAIAAPARADIIVPNGEPCEVLPVGARCYVRALVRGRCVERPSKHGPPTRACEPEDSDASAPAPSTSASARAPASPVPSAPPPTSKACSIGAASGPTSGGALFAIATAIALRIARARSRRGGSNRPS